MRWSLLGCVVALAAAAPSIAREPSPLAWTPDGRWVAYVSATRVADPAPAPGWIFGRSEAPAPAGPPSYRLWAWRPETGASVLLDEGHGPLTAPAWSPDGKALAFGRLGAPTPDGRSCFEVVVQEGPDRQRVIHRERLGGPTPLAVLDFPGLVIPWSPDGRLVAAPRIGPPGLVLLRVEDGGLVRALDDASLPAWAPRGGRLAFHQAGPAPGFYLLPAGPGEPRRLAGDAPPVGPPAWSADAKALWALGRDPAGAVQLLKLGLEGQETEVVRPLSLAAGPEPAPLTASFAIGASGQDFFSSSQVEGQASEIFHQQLTEKVVMKRWNPVDLLVPMGALATSPDGKWLALRAGTAGAPAVPAICRLEDQWLTPLVPDDATRAEWLAALIATARIVLRDTAPPPAVSGGPSERPTLIPAPGEPNRLGEGAIRLRHLANLGRPLCDRPTDSPAPTPALAALLAEARLFFAGLREDHDDTLAALDAFEPTVADPDLRLRLLALRAQVFLGRGDTQRARAAVAYLRLARPESPGRFEQTASGPVLTADPDPLARWISYLSGRAEAPPGAPDPAATPSPVPEPQVDLRPAFALPLPPPAVGPARARRRRIPRQAEAPKADVPPPPPAPAARP